MSEVVILQALNKQLVESKFNELQRTVIYETIINALDQERVDSDWWDLDSHTWTDPVFLEIAKKEYKKIVGKVDEQVADNI